MNTSGKDKNDIANNTNASKYAQAVLRCVQVLIDCVPSLNACILNVVVDGNTLVVFCTEKSKSSFVKQKLEPHWLGSIEVHCPGDMIVGSNNVAFH